MPQSGSRVGPGGELVLGLWPLAQHEGVTAHSLLGLGEGQMGFLVDGRYTGPTLLRGQGCPILVISLWGT